MPPSVPPPSLGSSTKPSNTMVVYDMEGNPLTLNLSKRGWMPPLPSTRPIGNTMAGRGDQYTSLDSLTPNQRRLLTEGMVRLLSNVPVSVIPNLPRTGYFYGDENRIELRRGTAKYISLHEAAHAYDASQNWAPSNNLPGLSYEMERELYNRYNGAPEKVDPTVNRRGGFYVSSLPAKEKFATMVQHGPYAIPPKLRPLFNGIYAPTPIPRTYMQSGR